MVHSEELGNEVFVGVGSSHKEDDSNGLTRDATKSGIVKLEPLPYGDDQYASSDDIEFVDVDLDKDFATFGASPQKLTSEKDTSSHNTEDLNKKPSDSPAKDEQYNDGDVAEINKAINSHLHAMRKADCFTSKRSESDKCVSEYSYLEGLTKKMQSYVLREVNFLYDQYKTNINKSSALAKVVSDWWNNPENFIPENLEKMYVGGREYASKGVASVLLAKKVALQAGIKLVSYSLSSDQEVIKQLMSSSFGNSLLKSENGNIFESIGQMLQSIPATYGRISMDLVRAHMGNIVNDSGFDLYVQHHRKKLKSKLLEGENMAQICMKPSKLYSIKKYNNLKKGSQKILWGMVNTACDEWTKSFNDIKSNLDKSIAKHQNSRDVSSAVFLDAIQGICEQARVTVTPSMGLLEHIFDNADGMIMPSNPRAYRVHYHCRSLQEGVVVPNHDIGMLYNKFLATKASVGVCDIEYDVDGGYVARLHPEEVRFPFLPSVFTPEEKHQALVFDSCDKLHTLYKNQEGRFIGFGDGSQSVAQMRYNAFDSMGYQIHWLHKQAVALSKDDNLDLMILYRDECHHTVSVNYDKDPGGAIVDTAVLSGASLPAHCNALRLHATGVMQEIAHIGHQTPHAKTINYYKSVGRIEDAFIVHQGKKESYLSVQNWFKESSLRNVLPHTLRNAFAMACIALGITCFVKGVHLMVKDFRNSRDAKFARTRNRSAIKHEGSRYRRDTEAVSKVYNRKKSAGTHLKDHNNSKRTQKIDRDNDLCSELVSDDCGGVFNVANQNRRRKSFGISVAGMICKAVVLLCGVAMLGLTAFWALNAAGYDDIVGSGPAGEKDNAYKSSKDNGIFDGNTRVNMVANSINADRVSSMLDEVIADNQRIADFERTMQRKTATSR